MSAPPLAHLDAEACRLSGHVHFFLCIVSCLQYSLLEKEQEA